LCKGEEIVDLELKAAAAKMPFNLLTIQTSNPNLPWMSTSAIVFDQRLPEIYVRLKVLKSKCDLSAIDATKKT
jgi:hypothetical protein